MKTLRNDYCIKQFTGSDKLRPALMQVAPLGEYLYATDAHIVAKIKDEYCVHTYNPVEKYPNAESVIASHQSIRKETLSVDALFHDLLRIECCFKPKMINCDECQGSGVCTCQHCNHEHECKECGGDGKMPGNELELSGEYHCTLLEKKYNLKYIDLIIKTAIYTGVKEIVISNDTGSNGTLFTVGNFTILLMPVYIPDM